MENAKNVSGYVGSVLAFTFGGVSMNDLVAFICGLAGIISAIVSVSFTIYKWIKKAKADGKISAEEIEELGDELKPQIDNLQNIMPKENSNNE